MIVTVKCYLNHRSLAGVKEMSVCLPEGATVAVLFGVLREKLGDLPAAERATFLVNQQVATQQTVLSDGARVLMFSPLVGG